MKEPLHSNESGTSGKSRARGKNRAKEIKQKEVDAPSKQEDWEFLLELAVHIREIRIKAGITQEKFYEDTNIHIGRIEAGRANISINTLNRICEYFHISVKDFFRNVEVKRK